MAKIPKVLHDHINTAFPATPCLLGTVLPNGYAQISPRGSTMVFDDEHLARIPGRVLGRLGRRGAAVANFAKQLIDVVNDDVGRSARLAIAGMLRQEQ